MDKSRECKMPTPYETGISTMCDEVPEPMRLLMQENSQALEKATSSIHDSRWPIPKKG